MNTIKTLALGIATLFALTVTPALADEKPAAEKAEKKAEAGKEKAAAKKEKGAAKADAAKDKAADKKEAAKEKAPEKKAQ